MTRHPVPQTASRRRAAVSVQPALAVAFWNLLFLDSAPFRPDPQQSPEWNRGAYLVAGLGHCGACHTPRNLLGAEKHGRDLDRRRGRGLGRRRPERRLAGAGAVGRGASLRLSAPRPGCRARRRGRADAAGRRRSRAGRRGRCPRHRRLSGGAAGRAVARARRERGAKALAQAAHRTDAAAGSGRGSRRRRSSPAPAPAAMSAAATTAPPRGIDLALSTAINDSRPAQRDHDRARRHRARRPAQPGPLMPGFAGAFTDAQLAGLVALSAGALQRRRRPGPTSKPGCATSADSRERR